MVILRYLVISLLCASLQLTADPWGKDADLVPAHHAEASTTTPAKQSLATYLIAFHQEVISPADGPRSHFQPSSSQYTLEAMRRYGFLQGYIMGCDRLMRENSEEWVYPVSIREGACLKHDPVPSQS